LISNQPTIPPSWKTCDKSVQACQVGRLIFLGLDGRLSSLTHPEYDLSKSRIPAAPTTPIEILLSLSRFQDTLTSTKGVYDPYAHLNDISLFIQCFFTTLVSSHSIFNFNNNVYLKFSNINGGSYWGFGFILCLGCSLLSVSESISIRGWLESVSEALSGVCPCFSLCPPSLQ